MLKYVSWQYFSLNHNSLRGGIDWKRKQCLYKSKSVEYSYWLQDVWHDVGTSCRTSCIMCNCTKPELVQFGVQLNKAYAWLADSVATSSWRMGYVQKSRTEELKKLSCCEQDVWDIAWDILSAFSLHMTDSVLIKDRVQFLLRIKTESLRDRRRRYVHCWKC